MTLNARILLPWLLLCLTLPAAAADLAGNWKAEVRTGNGTVITFVPELKTDGNNLTGTLQYATRKPKPLDKGVINGDEITFSVIEMSEAGPYTMSYKGKIEGDQLKIIGERENREGKMVKARDLTFTKQ